MAKLNPYIRIMRAAKAGRGVVLKARECRFLALDSAIEEVAARTGDDGQTSDGGSFIVTREGFLPKEGCAS